MGHKRKQRGKQQCYFGQTLQRSGFSHTSQVERSKDKMVQLLLLDNPLKFSDSPNHVIQRNCKPSDHNPKNCIVIQKK